MRWISRRGGGSTGTALREGQRCVHNELPPQASPDLFGPLGVASEAAFPIRWRGEIGGALTLYATEKSFFRAEELRLLEDVTSTISFALEQYDKEAHRQRMEMALRTSQERLTLALEAANDGLWDWDFRTNKAFYSLRYYAMLGYEPGDLRDDVAGLDVAGFAGFERPGGDVDDGSFGVVVVDVAEDERPSVGRVLVEGLAGRRL